LDVRAHQACGGVLLGNKVVSFVRVVVKSFNRELLGALGNHEETKENYLRGVFNADADVRGGGRYLFL
jgi:hypothetical protein